MKDGWTHRPPLVYNVSYVETRHIFEWMEWTLGEGEWKEEGKKDGCT